MTGKWWEGLESNQRSPGDEPRWNPILPRSKGTAGALFDELRSGGDHYFSGVKGGGESSLGSVGGAVEAGHGDRHAGLAGGREDQQRGQGVEQAEAPEGVHRFRGWRFLPGR